MKRYLMLTLTALLLGGCGITPQGDAIREAVLSRGAQAYDTGLESAEDYICTIASVGSVMRRYGRSQTTANAWRDICFGQEGGDLIRPTRDARLSIRRSEIETAVRALHKDSLQAALDMGMNVNVGAIDQLTDETTRLIERSLEGKYKIE